MLGKAGLQYLCSPAGSVPSPEEGPLWGAGGPHAGPDDDPGSVRRPPPQTDHGGERDELCVCVSEKGLHPFPSTTIRMGTIPCGCLVVDVPDF